MLEEEAFVPARILAPAVGELRGLGFAWCLLGLVAVGLPFAFGGLLDMPGIQAAGVALVLGLSVACALGGVLLAELAGPASLYWRLFDRAPAAPSGVPHETPRRTALRAGLAALAVAAVMTVICPVLLGIAYVLLGVPRDEVLPHLLAGTAVVVGGWTIACGLAALRVGHYFRHWERRRGRTVLCVPARSGQVRPVYCIAEQGRTGTSAMHDRPRLSPP
jgi:hypothetical protein